MYYPYEGASTGSYTAVTGAYHYVNKDTLIKGVSISSSSHNIRSVFDFDKSKIAYVKPAASNSTPAISSTFSETPSSVAYAGDDKKLVIKSEEISITNNITSNQLTSDRQNSEVTYRDNTIYVPYDSKSLTLKSGILNTSNASYISALIDKSGVKKYTTLGATTSDLTINLTDILDTKTVGSRQTISFYAEQVNAENFSDEISASPVTVNIEVAQGNEQSIKYNLDGGSGVAPTNATVRVGKLYMLEDGSGFFKETNKFSAWEMSYTPYGSDQETTRIVNSSESIVVPDTANQTISITALYSGIKASKTTETKSKTYRIAWDSNAPDGYHARFSNSELDGNFSADRDVKYNNVKLLNSEVKVPGKPVLDSDEFFFVGWYETTDQRNEVTGSVSVTGDKTYYGIWLPYTFYTDNGIDLDNPSKSNVKKYDMDWLQNKVDFLETGDKNSIDWMNDYYTFKNSRIGNARIYSLLKDSNGSWMNPDNAESWLEFRLIHFEDHDGDGSMFTFQMTHTIKDRKARFLDYGISGTDFNWSDSLFRKSVREGGTLYSRFDNKLTSATFDVEKKYNCANSNDVLTVRDNFFPLSYTEFQNNINEDLWTKDLFGSTYDFWGKQTVITDDMRKQSNAYMDSQCKGRRASNYFDDITFTWVRNASIVSDSLQLCTDKGFIQSYAGSDNWYEIRGTVYAYPCVAFAMGYKG